MHITRICINLPLPLSIASFSNVSTFAEIKAAVNELPATQQQELYAILKTRVETHPGKGLTPEEFEEWYKNARGAGLPG